MATLSDTQTQMRDNRADALQDARDRAAAIAASDDYALFVEGIRRMFPWRFQAPAHILERDYLRIVDHHLAHLIPLVHPYMESSTRKVFDFGCGSGGSAIALALVDPHVRCTGTDIDSGEIAVARDRARLYGVADRCEFHHVEPGVQLPFADGSHDFMLCSSVLEYAVDEGVREFCVREMVRLVRSEGLLFFSVPNRLYPYEIHTGKWGWNYFPALLGARTVDSGFWEVRKLARPAHLQLDRTPLVRLLRPWSNFCFRKKHD
jgi:ubiquinone/menaquinone biosynthesis C-methylase UbiE